MASVADLIAGRYQLGVRLGSGGMGDVWRAHDGLLDRTVAVKVPASTVTPGSAERFRREARAAARLNHPNVVAVYDWGGGNQPYIVMEFVEGESLRAAIHERGHLPEADVARIGAEIADALEHAHHHGVVHRDVKPGNVLLAPDGRVKVTDFGIALSSTAEGLTETGVVLGTVGYLAPEQAAGFPADARSDVYSLGVVLHELLHGTRPTGGEDPPRTEIERVVARCRAPEPAARYQRASEVATALRRATSAMTGVVVEQPTGAVTSVASVASVTSVASAATVGERTALLPPPPTRPAAPRPDQSPAPLAAPALPAAPTPAPLAEPAPAPALDAAPVAVPAAAAAPAPAAVVVRGRKARWARRRVQKFPKVAPAVKPLKPPKSKRVRRSTAPRHWRARHVAAVAAAVVAALAVGAVAYIQLTAPGPSAAVPAVTEQDVFVALDSMHRAGFEVSVSERASARPGGLILVQRPAAGRKIEQGSTVQLVVSSTSATVPDIVNEDFDTARVDLARRGLVNLTVADDFRTDVTPGIVTRTVPDAFSRTAKRATLTVYVARDPHVTVPDVRGKDQAGAIDQLHGLGLEVAIDTVTSRTVAAGTVMKNTNVGDILLRGDTVTITVSSGPRSVKVPVVLGSDRDDATATLEDSGFVVAVLTSPVTSSAQDGEVLGQSPSGGTAPEGSTVTITVGVRTRKG